MMSEEEAMWEERTTSAVGYEERRAGGEEIGWLGRKGGGRAETPVRQEGKRKGGGGRGARGEGGRERRERERERGRPHASPRDDVSSSEGKYDALSRNK